MRRSNSGTISICGSGAVGHGARRGVVAAARYEARQFGVRSALPSVTALRKCPELVFVPPRFDVYRAVSRQVHAVFAEFTDLIDLRPSLRGGTEAWKTASSIEGFET